MSACNPLREWQALVAYCALCSLDVKSGTNMAKRHRFLSDIADKQQIGPAGGNLLGRKGAQFVPGGQQGPHVVCTFLLLPACSLRQYQGSGVGQPFFHWRPRCTAEHSQFGRNSRPIHPRLLDGREQTPRVGEQYDLGGIRMIYERAAYNSISRISRPALASLSCIATPLCFATKQENSLNHCL
jgi:hypothetical protein